MKIELNEAMVWTNAEPSNIVIQQPFERICRFTFWWPPLDGNWRILKEQENADANDGA